MARIHVIYCGGCREAYDRGQWLGELKAELGTRVKEVEFCHARCDTPTMRLLMFGCAAACFKPDIVDREHHVPVHRIGPGGFFDGVIQTVEGIADILTQEISGIKGAS